MSCDLATMMWKAAMYFTDNWFEALRFYHDIVADFVETISPNSPNY